MPITTVKITNIRSIENTTLNLSPGINIFIGKNNSGKSTVIHTLLRLQYQNALSSEDIRIGHTDGNYEVQFNKKINNYNGGNITHNLRENQFSIRSVGTKTNIPHLPQSEPDNYIYPYLSKRKVAQFTEQINSENTNSVSGDMKNLYAKVDRLSNPSMPAHQEYMRVCQEIFGFALTTSDSTSGKKASYLVDDFRRIAVDKMGEGTTNVLGLLVDLCVAKNKLFLIEEPENDIHVSALRQLLAVIQDKAITNQFVISTHSNIVLKELGASAKSKIFEAVMHFDDGIPTTELYEVENIPRERIRVLESLGYEPFDLNLWDGWIFFEESSAETITRYILRWFFPELAGRIRTYSARTKDKVKERFEEFNRLFTFLNLEPVYMNRAWIVIDAGEDEDMLIEQLRGVYVKNGWGKNHFLQFSEHDFERYYPAEFQSEVDRVLSTEDRQVRRKEKISLLDSLIDWIEKDIVRAQKAFKESANDVIVIIQRMESELSKKETIDSQAKVVGASENS